MKSKSYHLSKGFTLIELLTVIAIIGLLSAIVVTSLTSARLKARDARRLNDVMQVKMALDLYFDTFHTYPALTGSNPACNGWYTSKDDVFMQPLITNKFLGAALKDPTQDGSSSCGNYAYYKFEAGEYGCPANKGDFYVLGVRTMETVTGSNIAPTSPGFKCPSRDFQIDATLGKQFDWVMGKFENE
ncbi:MAG: type II secretion system protein [Candidatus Paceibacterota bacterium]|jgi:prepilin-type N-terminal cleavage/methylation domain-containing protein|nr:type II secretion system GspH family protein [Candidatus Paceibacterota bacterium]